MSGCFPKCLQGGVRPCIKVLHEVKRSFSSDLERPLHAAASDCVATERSGGAAPMIACETIRTFVSDSYVR